MAPSDNEFDEEMAGTSTRGRRQGRRRRQRSPEQENPPEAAAANSSPLLEAVDLPGLMDVIMRHTREMAGSTTPTNNNRAFKDIQAFNECCRKDGITFHGKPGEDLKKFMSRMDDNLADFSLTEEQQVKAVAGLLKDRAEVWYQGRKGKIASWKQMKEELKKDFLVQDGDFDAKRRILNRRQRQNETLGEFVDHLLAENAILSRPLPDEDIIMVVVNNMNDKYRPLLMPCSGKILSVEHLYELCRAGALIFKEETEQPIGRQNIRKAGLSSCDFDEESGDEDMEVAEVKGRFPRPVNCYACGKDGHFSKDCPNYKSRRQPEAVKPPVVMRKEEPAKQSTSLEEEVKKAVELIIAALKNQASPENPKA